MLSDLNNYCYFLSHAKEIAKLLVLIQMQGVGSAVNKLNDVVAMIAEVKSIAESLSNLSKKKPALDGRTLRL